MTRKVHACIAAVVLFLLVALIGVEVYSLVNFGSWYKTEIWKFIFLAFLSAMCYYHHRASQIP